jgi:hypothetical protein
MTDVLGGGLFPARESAENSRSVSDSPRRSGDERIWRWTLRLALPLLLFLSGKVLYWIWFDNVYGSVDGCDIVGGLVLAIGAAVVALWALGSWCSEDVS